MVGAVLCVRALGGCFAAPAYRGPTTTHFDGETFANAEGSDAKSFWNLMKMFWARAQVDWQDRLEQPRLGPPPRRVTEAGRLRVTWINHSTVLLQLDGLNILTDPIYSERASPVSWAGPRRHRLPGVPFERLPPIDVVLISHNHYDHCDVPTLRRLAARDRPVILAGIGNRALFARHGIEGGHELDWGKTKRIGEVRLTFLPARHWSGRGIGDRNRALWGAWVIEGSGGPVYFAGDTGWGEHFEAAYRRFGAMRLALLPIGAYQPRWFMAASHISPTEAVAAHLVLHARQSLAIHHGTFQLSSEGQDQPVQDLRLALAARGIPERDFWALQNGEGREVPRGAADAGHSSSNSLQKTIAGAVPR